MNLFILLVFNDIKERDLNLKILSKYMRTNKSFNERCYELLRSIPKGKVTTYKQIAQFLGSEGYRAVGNAMAKNKDVKRNPCYKVVKSDGNLGSYQLGISEKKKLLERDGIKVSKDNKVDLKKYIHTF